MKEKLYADIKELFQEIDGENKDGVFVTLEGQQYQIKIVAKRSPVTFNGDIPNVKKIESIKKTDFIEKVKQAEVAPIDIDTIIELFGEDVVNV